jgi:hypothetical protein
MTGPGWIHRLIRGRRYRGRARLVARLVVGLLGITTAHGCGSGSLPPGAFLGLSGAYSYSPTALEIGNTQQFWWCGQAHNPDNPSQATDTIQYASLNLTTQKITRPVTVLAETPGTWDSAFLCNPKVVGGTFTNPLGDGQTYSYAMYYVATASGDGMVNSIGVAFSTDGVQWKKYSQPVIPSTTQTDYGVGQPAVYNSDQKSGVWLFFEDNRGAALPIQHVEARSTDGIHFSIVGNLTTNGLDGNSSQISWGDMAYDATTDNWYAAFNLPLRSSSTTGNIQERGQLGVVLYRIPNSSLLTGTTPWQLLHSFDTNFLGNESVFLAGFLRDQYGRVNVGSYPTIQLLTSISAPAPSWNASPGAAGKSAEAQHWGIGKAQWVPNSPQLALNRFSNSSTSEATTGWIDSSGGFKTQSILGHLYESPQQSADLAFYGCKGGSIDYFVSTDSSCAGQHLLGFDGYGYSQPQPGQKLVPLYSCSTGHGHFLSQDPQCEGKASSGQLLGYALP